MNESESDRWAGNNHNILMETAASLVIRYYTIATLIPFESPIKHPYSESHK